MTEKPSQSRFPIWVRRILGGVVLLILLVFISGYVWLRQSLPQLDGNVETTTIAAPVTVSRDADGVPSIEAVTRTDASYVLGYLHAQERFFQMDLLRRSGAGELSELFGDGALPRDRAHRRHRFRHRSELALQSISAEDLVIASAYTSGVNDGLKALGSPPFEYALLGAKPKSWSNADSLLIVYAMYFDLQDEDNHYERNYSLMHDVMGKEYVEFLAPLATVWDAPVDGGILPLAPIPENPPSTAKGSLASINRLSPQGEAIPGSNSWVVGGSLSGTGAAIVANDMHLGLSVPNIWYRVRLLINETGIDITGVSLPGASVIIVGSNTHIAWGFTNSQTDTQDIVYLDWVDEAAGIYQTPDGPASVEEVTEVICNNNGDCTNYLVRETIWGPMLENRDHNGRAMVTRWIAHDNGSVNMRLMDMEKAHTVEDAFRVAHQAGSPAQNLVVGDENGNIGYTLLGPLPARYGHSGLSPGSWSDGSQGWNGRLAAADVPQIINPPQNRLWSANARIVSGDMLKAVGFGDYGLAGRQHQIRERLMALNSANEDDLYRIQLDDTALFLSRWRNLLLSHFSESTDQDLLAALDKVRNWEGRAIPESIGYRVVHRFRSHVTTRAISGLTQPLASHLGDRFPWYSRTVEGPVWRLIETRPGHLLPSDYKDWNSLIDIAMQDVLEEIADKGGLEAFTWGAYSELRIDHPLSAFVPGLGFLTDTPHEQTPGEFGHMPRIGAGRFGASQRMVVSPGHEENGIFQMPSGQSGHPLSPYFNKGHENWVNGTKSPLLPGTPVWTLEFHPPERISGSE